MIHLSNDTTDLFQQTTFYAQKQVRKLIERDPDYYPLYTQNGKWRHEGQAWSQWCDGFLPGMMWIFARRAEPESTDANFWREQAIRYTTPLEPRKRDRDVHGLGFIFHSTYYRWWMLDHDPGHREVLIEAGKTMALRYRENGRYLRSFVAPESLFIDIIMNLGVIYFAARETNDRRLYDIANRHAHTTRRHLVRGDGSVAQEGIFDTDTGEFLQQTTHQGYRGDSCWSRGLAWALYGFTTCYEYSLNPHFLGTAEACADYYIRHSPADGIAPWDFDAPPENRTLVDTSAAAICASGLLRLCRVVPDPLKGHLYWSTAVHILNNLCQKWVVREDREWEGILRGGVYHVNRGLGVDESSMWGDYYFCEALDRALWKR